MAGKLHFTHQALLPVVEEAIRNGSSILLVKDHGVYLMASSGEMDQQGKSRKHIAYAEGLNPNTQDFDDWYDLARLICGGDDFAEHIENKTFKGVLSQKASVDILMKPESFSIILRPERIHH